MKKKILIILLISIFSIVIIVSYCIVKNKTSKIQVSDNPILEEDLLNIDDNNELQNIEDSSNILIDDEQDIIEENAEESVEESLSQNKQETTQVKNSAISNVVNNKTETEQVTTQKSETSSKKEEIPSTVNESKTEIATETKAVETPIRCTNNNNHGMEVGNSGKWFSSKNEAIAYYNSQISYWGNLWETDKIDDATYYQKCPSGYEIWDCMYCSKWTINFYYR